MGVFFDVEYDGRIGFLFTNSLVTQNWHLSFLVSRKWKNKRADKSKITPLTFRIGASFSTTTHGTNRRNRYLTCVDPLAAIILKFLSKNVISESIENGRFLATPAQQRNQSQIPLYN
jgi:hypothetical protein